MKQLQFINTDVINIFQKSLFFCLLLILLLLPLLFRTQLGVGFVETQAINRIALEDLSFYDNLAYQGVSIPFSLSLVFLHFIFQFMSPLFYVILATLLLFLLFLPITKRICQTRIHQYLTLAFFFLSPVYLWTFASVNVSLVSVLLLVLFGVLFLFNKLRWFCFALAIVIPFFGLVNFILLFLIILLLFFQPKVHFQYKRTLLTTNLVLALFGLVFYSFVHFFTGGSLVGYVQIPFISDSLVLFGGLNAFFVVLVMLAIAGLVLYWQPKTKPLVLVSASTIFLSFILPDARLFAAMFIAYFGGYSILRLKNHVWQLPVMKPAIFFIIGLFFTLSFVFLQVDLLLASPTIDEVKVSTALETIPQGSVLAYPEHSFVIETAGLMSFVSDDFTQPLHEQRVSDLYYLLNISRLSIAEEKLAEFNITYILLLQDRQEIPLDTPLSNVRVFSKIYDKNGFELYVINTE